MPSYRTDSNAKKLALQERALPITTFRGQVHPEASSKPEPLHLLPELAALIAKVAKSTTTLYATKWKGSCYELTRTADGKKLVELLLLLSPILDRTAYGLRFDPRIEGFALFARDAGLLAVDPESLAHGMRHEAQTYAAKLNWLVQRLRDSLGNRAFASQLQTHQRLVKERRRAHDAYFKPLVKDHPAATVLRLEVRHENPQIISGTLAQWIPRMHEYLAKWQAAVRADHGSVIVGGSSKLDCDRTDEVFASVVLLVDGVEPDDLAPMHEDLDQVSRSATGNGLYVLNCKATSTPMGYRSSQGHESEGSLRDELIDATIYQVCTDEFYGLVFENGAPTHALWPLSSSA
jgi:hypothetical protein